MAKERSRNANTQGSESVEINKITPPCKPLTLWQSFFGSTDAAEDYGTRADARSTSKWNLTRRRTRISADIEAMAAQPSLRNGPATAEGFILSTSSNEEGDGDEVTALHDFIAGGVAGSASVIVGHPFDTIKVRLQTSTASGSTSLSSMATSFGGISSLFRGLAAPLSTAAVVNAIIFSSYGTSSRVYDDYFANNENQQLPHDPWQKAMLCGSFAGAVQCVVICPMEHLKCRLQVQQGKGTGENVFKGPFHAAKQIVRQYGISGLYRGWNVTCLREIPSFGAYFAFYDYAKDTVQDFLLQRQRQRYITSASTTASTLQQQQDYEDEYAHTRLLMSSAIAGGMSGCITWGVVYPVDVIKTRIQTNPLSSTQPHHRLIIPAAQAIVSKQGWKSLFRGLGITLIRAFPVNGTVFPVYEFTLMHVSNLDFDYNYDYKYN